MPSKFPTLLAATCLALLAATPIRAAEGPQAGPTAPQIDAGDWESMRRMLQATDEEWTVLFPQIFRICALREDLAATAAAIPPSQGPFANAGPMGGTSLAAPEMPNRARGPATTRPPTAGTSPFDPKKAPGAANPDSSLMGAVGGLLMKGFIGMLIPDMGHPVQAVLTELRTLLNSRDATDDQIREKLATVRAVRTKSLRDLAAAQKELAPYLTLDQAALLVSLGILD